VSDRGAVEAALRAAQAAVTRLAPGAGQRVVAGRAEGYRPFDPDVIGVDTAAERAVIRALREHGVHGTLLSEEAGERPLPPRRGARGAPVYAICDPFDGSLLYRRGIRALWFTALGLYGEDGTPRAAGLIDHVTGELAVADAAGAVRRPRRGARPVPLRPRPTARLAGAFFEAYLMKPAFLYPTATALRPIFERGIGVLPNGGPAGFVDVAAGRVDVYFAWQEALTEVFSAVYVAQRAGCVVTGWDGAPLRFRPDIRALYSLVCSATPRLHAEVLRALRDVPPPAGLAP
jgi:fructose-1,6-bisphosphatase/inositol monophosphatase family enzyme